MIEYIKPTETHTYINVKINNIYIGELAVKEDGYWDWYPKPRPGYIPSWVLRAIADKLDEINKPWDE